MNNFGWSDGQLHNTADTDWLANATDDTTREAMAARVAGQAKAWFQRLPAIVLSDRGEFRIQANAEGQRVAAPYDLQRDEARAIFVRSAERLLRLAEEKADEDEAEETSEETEDAPAEDEEALFEESGEADETSEETDSESETSGEVAEDDTESDEAEGEPEQKEGRRRVRTARRNAHRRSARRRTAGESVEVASLPNCDLCGQQAQYDAKTTMGPWANLCELCFAEYGPGRLGTGYGQRLVVKSSRRRTASTSLVVDGVDLSDVDWNDPALIGELIERYYSYTPPSKGLPRPRPIEQAEAWAVEVAMIYSDKYRSTRPATAKRRRIAVGQISYSLYTNVDGGFMKPYQRGERLADGYSGKIEAADETWVTLERIFVRHNMDDRPDGQTNPSLSVGDVVVLGNGEAWSVNDAGFVQVEVDPADFLNMAWTDTRDLPERSAKRRRTAHRRTALNVGGVDWEVTETRFMESVSNTPRTDYDATYRGLDLSVEVRYRHNEDKTPLAVSYNVYDVSSGSARFVDDIPVGDFANLDVLVNQAMLGAIAEADAWADEDGYPGPALNQLQLFSKRRRTAGGAFPGAGAQVYYNEDGEPLGWDYPSDDEPDYDPYEDEDYWANEDREYNAARRRASRRRIAEQGPKPHWPTDEVEIEVIRILQLTNGGQAVEARLVEDGRLVKAVLHPDDVAMLGMFGGGAGHVISVPRWRVAWASAIGDDATQDKAWNEWLARDAHLSARRRTSRRRTAMPNPVDLGVKVGDIFYSSWGYDQTNVDFYEVVGLTGASVKVREVAQERLSSDGYGSDQVVPVPGDYIGEVMTKRISDARHWSGTASIKISQSTSAYLWDGTPRRQTSMGWGH